MVQTPEEQTELEHTIQTLQQILEVMPDNTDTLRTLYGAFIQIGELEKALETLARLESAAHSVGDQDALNFVLEQYASIEDEAPELKKHADTLRTMNQGAPSQSSSNTIPHESPPSTPTDSVEQEMALAWELLQDEQLSQEEYAGAISDLTEISSSKGGAPITLLNALFDRNFSRMERLLVHLSTKTGVPIIDMSRFEADEELNTLFTPEFCINHAIVPFGKIGNEILIGVLNPVDPSPRTAAAAECGRPVHPCLVGVQDFDLRYDAIKKAQEA